MRIPAAPALAPLILSTWPVSLEDLPRHCFAFRKPAAKFALARFLSEHHPLNVVHRVAGTESVRTQCQARAADVSMKRLSPLGPLRCRTVGCLRQMAMRSCRGSAWRCPWCRRCTSRRLPRGAASLRAPLQRPLLRPHLRTTRQVPAYLWLPLLRWIVSLRRAARLGKALSLSCISPFLLRTLACSACRKCMGGGRPALFQHLSVQVRRAAARAQRRAHAAAPVHEQPAQRAAAGHPLWLGCALCKVACSRRLCTGAPASVAHAVHSRFRACRLSVPCSCQEFHVTLTSALT